MNSIPQISFAFRVKFLLKTFTVLAIFLSSISQQVLGQFTEDFSDGDFISNPNWSGSSPDFMVNPSGQLQLNNTVAGTSYLVVPFSFATLGESQWQFNIRQDFSPSSSNFSRLYLMSDREDLTSELNGYYLQFGETGSNDAVELFRQTGLSSVSVCRADNSGEIASSFNIAVKVNRSAFGEWEIRIDYEGGTNFILEASGTDNTHLATSFFGIRCTYTKSNATRFFYDDFAVSALASPDLIPPVVSSIAVLSQTEIELSFSEPLNTTAETELNYSIAGETTNPIASVLQSDQRTVLLTFAEPFDNGIKQTLSVKNVSDTANNIMVTVQIDFLFFQPVDAERRDIIITEIFPDPSPPVSLPEAEFIELYNRSENPFDLSGWTFTDGSSTGDLSSGILLPGEYLILSSSSTHSQFVTFGKAMGTSPFPSLNNAGDILVLKDPEGKTIDSVAYSSTWYNDEDKEDGGWSLELIDPEDFCRTPLNWKASLHESGGTPGKQNSVFAHLPDNTGPKLLSASRSGKAILVLEFDEALDQSVPSPESIIIEPIISIVGVSFMDDTFTKISLSLSQDLDSTQTYSITVHAIYDCPGNEIQEAFSNVLLKLDTIAPQIQSLAIIGPHEIALVFSEQLDRPSAEDRLNYEVVDVGNPESVTLQSDKKTIKVLFAQPFANGVINSIQINNILDLAGNPISVQNKEFMFFEPVEAKFKDVVITEIFADPAPVMGLPEVEFIEFYNRSDGPFDLNEWKISDSNNIVDLLSAILLPNQYLILCNQTKTSEFISYGKTMGLPGFPLLNNTGEALVLKDRNGLTVDSVNYADTWYKDDEKKDGGCTLELIDPENTCSESENWIASEHDRGGTPGEQNSVFANKPDLTGPKLLSVFPISNSIVLLTFNEKLEKTLPSVESFILEPGLQFSGIQFADASLTGLQLILAKNLEGGTGYQINVKDVYDCAGNVLQSAFSSLSFALPERAEKFDLAVNEVLFNPRSTGTDFVEVYNRSAKFINLKNWKLANLQNDTAVNAKTISGKDFLLAPHAYAVFTEDGNVLKGEYLQSDEETFLEMDMPSFPDDDGSVALLNEAGEIIDAFFYSDQYHSGFIKDEEGVSLERISFNAPADNRQNWKSASSVSGFATPGYLNSNSRSEGISDQAVIVEPEIFMPVSGQPDFAQIRYNFDHGGYIANVKIFDSRGREIKQIANNELLGTDGFFRWDGDRNNGSKASIGAYMVWFEVFDEGGVVKTFRERVVVAGRFR